MDIARRCGLHCAAVLVFVVTFALAESAARAKEVTAQLDYVAASGCPGADDFEGAVARQLGYSPFRRDASQRVLVRIELSGQALAGRLEWRDADGRWMGERTFPSRSGDCRELVRAMGFALALQVQLLAAEAAAGAQPSAPAGGGRVTPPTAATTPALPSPGSPREGARSRPTIAAGAGGAVGIGLAPTVVALGRVFGTVAWSHVALELGGEVSTPSAMHRADGTGFSEQTLLGSLAVCGLRMPFSACAVTKVGEMRVVGEGVDAPVASSGILLQTGVRAAVTRNLGRHAHIVLRADGLAALTRGMVTLNSMPVWTAPRIAGALGLDLAVRFP